MLEKKKKKKKTYWSFSSAKYKDEILMAIEWLSLRELIQQEFIRCINANHTQDVTKCDQSNETKANTEQKDPSTLSAEIDSNHSYVASQLGLACFASSLSPAEAITVFEDINFARSKFVLQGELHLVYELTPVYHNIEPDWDLYFNIICQCSENHHSEVALVAKVIGISEGFLFSARQKRPNSTVNDGLEYWRGIFAFI